MTWYWGTAIVVGVLLVLVGRRGEGRGVRRPESGDAPASSERIDEFLQAGQKIEAIKEYRALHGAGLKDAKHAIEARARDLGY